MAQAVLIVNPYASRVTDELVDRVVSTLGDVDLRVTERGGHATELAREAAGEVEAIYVFSGDGGFNEALNGSDARRSASSPAVARTCCHAHSGCRAIPSRPHGACSSPRRAVSRSAA